MCSYTNIRPKTDKAAILTKAIRKLAVELDLTQQELSLIIGSDKFAMSCLFKNDPVPEKNKQFCLDPASKEGHLAILLLRLYQNLDVLFGGNTRQSRLWLRSDNVHLQKKPIDLIKSEEGMVMVLHYLDAMDVV
ncbi:MAG TPA: MbcA/ParS/Xre antitoxin family protein [Gammaproteobacteria bacterium]|nr:MbcA/ParS/Xre antitoxin family protein [Gammaproteobacteria bacterium]